jgi:AmiR/NasT family two-component response regulator
VLSIAFHNFALKREREDALHRTEERLQLRGTVLRAALALMKRLGIGDEESLHLLRTEAMRRRVTLEAVSSLVLEGHWIGPNANRTSAAPCRQEGELELIVQPVCGHGG